MTLHPALCGAFGTEWNKTLALKFTSRRGRMSTISWGIKEGFPEEGPFELGIKGCVGVHQGQKK